MIKLNGTKLALELQNKIKLDKKNSLRLDIIQIGNDYASSLYIKRKRNICETLNIKTKLWKLSKNTSNEEVIKLIDKLNSRSDVNGILLQLPIPKKLDPEFIIKKINPLKDVDVFNKKTLKLKDKNQNRPIPCLVGAIEALKTKYKISFDNKIIVIIGKGRTGGLPIINWYKNSYKVISLDKRSKNINSYVEKADILISAIGKTKVIDATKIKKGAIFFDIGINRINKNLKKISGDIDYNEAKKRAKFGTPVPGGIGPLTIIMLIKNLIILSRIQNEQEINNCI